MSIQKLVVNKKIPLTSFIVGFGVASVHFFVTPFFEESFIWLLMLAPSFIPIAILALNPFAANFLQELFSINTESILGYIYRNDTLIETLFQLFSSLFYGALAGMLARTFISKNYKLQWVFIIILLLIIYFGCFLLSLAGQSFA